MCIGLVHQATGLTLTDQPIYVDTVGFGISESAYAVGHVACDMAIHPRVQRA